MIRQGTETSLDNHLKQFHTRLEITEEVTGRTITTMERVDTLLQDIGITYLDAVTNTR